MPRGVPGTLHRDHQSLDHGTCFSLTTMPQLTIDGRKISAEDGSTILQAARAAGIEIPTLCHLEGYEAGASCMVCAVKLKHNGQLIPSCASRVIDGMEIESDSEDVRGARRMALELLFSDHLGDCMAPCHSICPARMDIPTMIRQIALLESKGLVERQASEANKRLLELSLTGPGKACLEQ